MPILECPQPGLQKGEDTFKLAATCGSVSTTAFPEDWAEHHCFSWPPQNRGIPFLTVP